MSTVDFVVAVMMGLSILLAVLRGFTREVLTIIAFVGAVAAVVYGLPVARPVFRGMFEDQTTADIAAGALLGIVTLVVLSVISHRIAKSVNKAGLGMVDRTLGAGFGVLRAGLVLCILYIGLQWAYPEHLPDAVTEARSTPLIAKASGKLVAMLPESVQSEIKPSEDKDKKAKAEARDDIDKATDTVKDAKDAVIAPAPPEKPAEKPAEKPSDAGYDKSDRGSLDKLIQKDGNETK